MKPSAPYKNDGPSPDGANFYQFTTRAEGEVSCTGTMAEISVTVVFHHATNGIQGAVTGRTTVCRDKPECASFADYHRGRLYCYEVYRYDDYAQVTAVFKGRASDNPKTIQGREGRHAVGDSYKPRLAGCK